MNKSDITKEKILSAAEEVFSEKGIAGARVDEIAELSGVNKRMIYVYFGNKEQLYENVLRKVYGRLADMEDKLDTSLPPDEALRKVIMNSFRHLEQNPSFVSLVMRENLNRAKHVASSGIIPIKSKSIVMVQKIIKSGIDMGIFREDIDINEIVFAVNMYVFSYFSNIYTMPRLVEIDLSDKDKRRKRAAMLADMILGYLMKE